MKTPAATKKSSNVPLPKRSDSAEQLSDEALQDHLLQGVSRTFALTIPLLPEPLRGAISNAYLLCRTIDTIEDEPELDFAVKREQCRRYVEVVEGKRDPKEFAYELLPLIASGATEKERELVAFSDRIVGVTYRLPDKARKAIERCIRIMSEGMIHFQKEQSEKGLPALADLNRYCYVVAGVVGEMLTDLFCLHSPATAENYDRLKVLSTSFGQGLQMTNILKDVWEDYHRGACWLPRDIFEEEQFDLRELSEDHHNARFEAGCERLIGVAHTHLRNAFQYTLYVSPKDKGVRRFCLLALGLAILTLQKINANRLFTRGEQVKISRNSVKYTYLLTKWSAPNDWLLNFLFKSASRGLPLADSENAKLLIFN
jgi:farnesyl-diphosphate farnesyltransferase